MPATEETYRSQPTLHLVFAITSIAMLLATAWMILVDHLRPWKQVQRTFHSIEHDKLEAAKAEKLEEQKTQYAGQIAEIDQKIADAEAKASERYSELRKIDADLRKLEGAKERIDTERRFKKAELDSQRSLYDGMVDLAEEVKARQYLNTVVVESEKQFKKLSEDLEAAEIKVKAGRGRREELLGFVDNLKKERDRLTREVDRVDRLIEQKDAQFFGLRAKLRGLPLIDLAAPPTKIQQISLPDLTINYNFKEVPRYDRCGTCHQGIDRIGYDKKAGGEPMDAVFASHPFLTTGATTVDPKGNTVPAGLYLDPNGPHPMNSFGCTICHGGQGSGTDFTYASHTPNGPAQEEEWKEKHGWQHVHYWDYPMYPKRFIESSCVKCHDQVTDIPQATKLQAGYQRVVKYGCTGCHTIGGEGVLSPDLTDERQVGPNLTHVGSKTSKEWLLKWIKNPHAFRPDSRMPRFYGLINNNGSEDWPKNHAEIQAIVHYLFSKSTPPTDFVDPPAKSDTNRGKELFLQKGCLACHQHKPYEASQIQQADSKGVNPAYKPDPSLTFAPDSFPAAVREYAKADYGPNLSNISAKFQSKEQGHKFLTNWIQAPERYHPKSLMPNLQLSIQDAADIASWILSVPGEWPVKVDVPGVETKEVKTSLDELVKLYVSKGGFRGKDGKMVVVPLSEIDGFVEKKLGVDEKLYFLGEKTIGRLGCFGCHSIPGFENAKPIGTPLSDWGLKNPARLDFGHITEYIEDQPVNEQGARDGTAPYFLEELEGHTRTGFLYEKLHRPRSYDYLKKSEKYKTWDDRLRMPQFAWADDADAVEEVMTFILGLTGEKVATKYLPKSRDSASRMAVAQGAKLLNRFNCAGCHVLEMPKFTIPPGTKIAEAFSDFKTNLRSSYSSRANDYLKEFYPDLSYDPNKKLGADQIESELGIKPEDGASITIEGMPTGLFENELSVQLWRPATIRGYTFNTGDIVTLDQTKIQKTPAVGGDFAWLYSTHQAERTGASVDTFWNRLPPPLLREGNKVQTPWLMSFLKDPYAIRPAAQLRMPKFHYGKSDQVPTGETEELANYFAARDNAEYPYQAIPEKTEAYLSSKEKAHANYLGAGWTMMANKASPCIQCHAIGTFKPTGGDQVVNGPDLRQVNSRFRPGYLETWLANPRRLVPYSAMPQNVAPHGKIQLPVPKEFEDKPIEVVRAIRDTLLNYINAVEQQLATAKPDTPKAAMNAKATGGTE